MFAPSTHQADRSGAPALRTPFTTPFGLSNQQLATLVQSVLAEVTPFNAAWPEQDDLFADVGEYVVKCSEMLADVADRLVNSHQLLYQIHQAQQQQQQQQAQQWRDSNNFGYALYLTQKHESLKNITSTLRATADSLRNDWTKSDNPPSQPQHHQPQHHQQHHQQQQSHSQARLTMNSPYDHNANQAHHSQHRLPPTTTPPSRRDPPNLPVIPTTRAYQPTQQQAAPQIQSQQQQQPQYTSQPSVSSYATADASMYTMGLTPPSVTSIDQMDDGMTHADENRIRQILSQPQHRGVGQHYCPLGERCDKGGLDPDGKLRLFERNSDFRTHLKKHFKMYKCPVAGCKNVEGFGRKDQLERHIRTTKHGPSPPTVPGPGVGIQPPSDFPPMIAHRY